MSDSSMYEEEGKPVAAVVSSINRQTNSFKICQLLHWLTASLRWNVPFIPRISGFQF